MASPVFQVFRMMPRGTCGAADCLRKLPSFHRDEGGPPNLFGESVQVADRFRSDGRTIDVCASTGKGRPCNRRMANESMFEILVYIEQS